LKNYYFILSLNLYASDAEIKQSYRKLALQFHPDKNPTPEAEAIFKEVNEAYEVLGDPLRKAIYDQMLRGVPAEEQIQEEPKRTHRDPRYRPKPTAHGPRRPTHREEILAMMASNLRYALMISRLTLLFSVILITDYSLPSVKTVTEVLAENPTNRGSSFKLELRDGKTVSVTREGARNLRSATKIGVYRSAWLAVPLSVEDEATHYRAPVYVSIYGNFIFWPILLLLTSLVGTFYWKGVEFRFNVGVVNFILFLLTLIFLNVHRF
jgi:curved DNA-binding protein CbpA